jgi:hypothetical protein
MHLVWGDSQEIECDVEGEATFATEHIRDTAEADHRRRWLLAFLVVHDAPLSRDKLAESSP